MAMQAEPIQVGQALVVRSTGSGGAVSIVWNDSDDSQLELGRMSKMIVDDDVLGGSLPDLGDAAVEAGLVADLWQEWESFEPAATPDTTVVETSDDAA